MKRTFILTIMAWMLTVTVSAQSHRRWDFTNWSQQTIENLKAEAAQTRPANGWSDIEKKGDDKEGAVAPEATKDNCFWLTDSEGAWLTDPEGGSLKANGMVIPETEGLIFNPAYTLKRSLAIAVNYPSTSLGQYAGEQYLWLGGGSQNLACFVIPNVTVGQKIVMTVESHKPSDTRGVELYVGSVSAENKIGDSFKPTTQETYTWENWTLPETIEEPTSTVDIIVYNTSGCHLYNIEVGEDTGQKRSVGLIYNGDLSNDLTYTTMNATPTLDVKPIEANGSLSLESLTDYDAVVVSSTVNDESAINALKTIRPFVPMLNLNASLYPKWGYGEATEAGIPFATVLAPNHALFSNMFLIEDTNADTPTFVMEVTGNESHPALAQLAGPFANDAILARPYQNDELVSIHAHNMSHNGYLYLPFSQEVLEKTSNSIILENAVAILATSKSPVTAAPKPTITLAYNKLNTDVTMKSGVPGAQIFYTLDGSTPTEESTLYTEPINVTTELTIKAVALGDGYLLSDVAEQLVDLKDQATAPTIAVNQDGDKAIVTITSDAADAEIWFNLIGSDNKARSQKYTEPIELKGSATVGAFVEAYEGFLRSELATQQVNLPNAVTYTELLTKFEGASFNAIGNVLNGGFPYYSEQIIDSKVYKDVNGEDSIVNTYQKRDSMVVYNLSDDWHIKTFGQGLYYTKATTEHNVASAKGYNPETVFDDQNSVGEITSNAVQFQVVSKKDGDGRLDPPSASLETVKPFEGPFEVGVYYSGKNVNSDHVLDVFVSTDTLNVESWTKIGELYSVSQPYYDGNSDKSFRVWKRGSAVYQGTDPVFVKVASVENAKDVNIFTIVVKAPGVVEAITTTSSSKTVSDGYIYDLQGRKLNGIPQKGIYIKNGKKYLVH